MLTPTGLRRMKSLLVSSALIGLLAAGCAGPAPTPNSPALTPPTTLPAQAPSAVPSATPAPGLTSADCPFPLPDQIRAGQDVICAWVNVPQEHAQPEGPQIRLRVVVIKSTAANPAPDPLVIEAGGPGVSTIASVPGLLAVTQFNLRAERDLVLIEQRGTHYSDPLLFCDELLQVAKEQVARPDAFPVKKARELQAAAACKTRLEAQGVRLSAYNSLENAADIPAVLTALGYERFNFYGVSYATLLGQHLARDYPQRLRSLILDAPVPLGSDYASAAPQNTQRAFEQLFANCAADPACQAAYPDLKASFFAQVEALNAAPRRLSVGEMEAEINGDTLVLALYQNLSAGQPTLLPGWIDAWQRGSDSSLVTGLGAQALSSVVTSAMSYAVRCAEEPSPAPRAQETGGVHPRVEATLRDAFEIGPVCAAWNLPHLPQSALAPVSSSIPTLILSGDLDPITPPANGAILAQRFSRSQHYTFPGLGHGAFLRHACPTALLLDFVSDPTRAPDAGCLAGMTLRFVVPAAEIQLAPFRDDEYGIQGVLPVGWGKVQAGLYLMSADGQTALLEVSKLPDTPLEAQIASWLPGLGIQKFPASSATRRTPAFTWELYSFPASIAGIGPVQADVAIAQTGSGIYYVGLYAPANLYEKFHTQIFLPVVDGLEAVKR